VTVELTGGERHWVATRIRRVIVQGLDGAVTLPLHGAGMTTTLIVILSALVLRVVAPLIVELLADPHRTVESWRRLLRNDDDELPR